MQLALDVFRLSIQRTRHLGGLHGALASLTTPAVDTSDLLRAQLVLAISALDYLIHELTVLGMIEIFDSARVPTDAFKKYKVSGHLLVPPNLNNKAAFEDDVRDRHSFLSFQQPDKIADALRLIDERPLWTRVSVRLGRTDAAVKTQLRLLVDRRNKIAHESDVDPSYPGARWPISPSLITVALDFIEVNRPGF